MQKVIQSAKFSQTNLHDLELLKYRASIGKKENPIDLDPEPEKKLGPRRIGISKSALQKRKAVQNLQ